MTTLLSTPTSISPTWETSDALAAASLACQRIAPLWPLRHFVAVNPFLGLTDHPFVGACERVARVVPGGMLMESGYYREKLANGEISETDLEAAITRAGEIPDLFPPDFLAGLHPEKLRSTALTTETPDESNFILAFAETVDQLRGSRWGTILTEATTDFCAAYFDEGQSAWRTPWKGVPLYQAWRETAMIDRQLDCLGLAGFRDHLAAMPASPTEAISLALTELQIDTSIAPDYLHRLLLSIRGWAGALQYRVREATMRGSEDDSLIELLAIRAAGEAALQKCLALPGLAEFWPPVTAGNAESSTSISTGAAIRYLLQLAHEHAWETRMRNALAASSANTPAQTRPEVQAVFCIDVRSEIFRRSLESVSAEIHTRGFAGFFGLPIEYRPMERENGQAQCPALLLPQYTVDECHHDALHDTAARNRLRLGKRLSHGWNAFKTSAVSCFSFVETAGLLFGGSLLRDSFAPAGRKGDASHSHCGPSLDGIPVADRPTLAHGMLKNMGLTGGFGRLVLLCGHGGETANNPYGSGLDCGACGGHAGDANARVGAALLNDPAVRKGLAEGHGLEIPADTWFLAGLHNTTTDDVTLFDLASVPATHATDIAALQESLTQAAAKSRRERSDLLGLSAADPDVDEKVRSRACDWSEVRPEWGLAGNAAFVAAPRARTRKSNLGGRVFLHDYDHRTDPDNSILELIMAAPMVVANWINLQYFGSTVNNPVFGSGNKVLHNVVGTLGVCLGNKGDLQTGLPLQSVHDGTRFIHEPLRLHVFLEAPEDRIDAVLEKHDHVRELVAHQWLHLFAVGEDGAVSRRRPGGDWETATPIP